MRHSTCAEYARQLAQLSAAGGEVLEAAIASKIAGLLDLHGCARGDDAGETEEVLPLESVCPRCGWRGAAHGG